MVALQNEIQAMMNIGLIGCGMWGRNLARNLAQLNVLASVADRHAENAGEFGSAFATKPVGNGAYSQYRICIV
jgi:predicted dehydrogenase